MKRKFLSLALCLMMVLSLIAVPTSAEGEVALLESWFVDTATNARVYDTSAAVTVKPAFYVNNETGVAITDAKLVLASYNADNKLEVVKFTAAPTIAEGESRVKLDESIAVSAGGETYMMIWDTAYAPIVPKTELTTTSRQAEILSFSVNGTEGLITNELKYVTLEGSQYNGNNQVDTYTREKSIEVILPSGSSQDLTAVSPVISVPENATIEPASEVAQDFSEGKTVSYTVTAADGLTTTTYTVSVRKNSYRVWGETFESCFPVLTYDDYTAETPVISVKDIVKSQNELSGTYLFNSTTTSTYYYLNKWVTYVGSTAKVNSAKLYYTKAQIDSGDYVLRAGEMFDPPIPENDTDANEYYTSTSDATKVNANEAAGTAIKYVVTKNSDDSYSNVVTSGYTLALDPDSNNSNNYCFRYDKRGQKADINTIFKQVHITPNTAQSKIVDTLSYSFDLYVDKTAETSTDEHGTIGLWHSSSTATAYTLSFRPLTNGNLEISLAKALTKPSGSGSQTYRWTLGTIKNGCNRWLDLDIRIKLNSDGTNPYIYVYAEDELIAKSDIKSGDKVSTTPGSNSARNMMTFATSSTTSMQTYYIDNINTYVLSHQ